MRTTVKCTTPYKSLFEGGEGVVLRPFTHNESVLVFRFSSIHPLIHLSTFKRGVLQTGVAFQVESPWGDDEGGHSLAGISLQERAPRNTTQV